jgi:hypothetical protein
MRDVRRRLGIEVNEAKLTMLFNGRWKYVFAEKFRSMVFDFPPNGAKPPASSRSALANASLIFSPEF